MPYQENCESVQATCVEWQVFMDSCLDKSLFRMIVAGCLERYYQPKNAESGFRIF